jgi:polysaccharide export outer membrane protein
MHSLIRQVFIGTLALTALYTSSAIAGSPFGEDYKVQPGDTLFISVWKEEDLQREVLVRPDGGMSFPLVGDLTAAGKTVPQINAEIEKRLARYIPDPVVTVTTQAIDGNVVYVIGKVNRPGPYNVQRYVDVVQALSMAGGMTPYAAVDKIKIMRRQGGKLKAIPFEYGDIEKGRNLDQNIVLQSGDVLVVP